MTYFEHQLDQILTEYAPTPGRRPKPVRPSPTAPTVPPATEDATIPLEIGYGTYMVFQQYWEGQGDPLYAVLSRRGSSVDWVTVFVTPEEADRLEEVAQEIAQGDDERDAHVARQFLQRAYIR